MVTAAYDMWFFLLLFAVSADIQKAFLHQSVYLYCGSVNSTTADWTHQVPDDARRHIVVGGNIQASNGRYSVDISGLLIREVKFSDAGDYLCGHDANIYHKIRLVVAREWSYITTEIVYFVNRVWVGGLA